MDNLETLTTRMSYPETLTTLGAPDTGQRLKENQRGNQEWTIQKTLITSVSGLSIPVVSVSRLSIHAVSVSGLSILVVSVSRIDNAEDTDNEEWTI
jgi:hypothetical protein